MKKEIRQIIIIGMLMFALIGFAIALKYEMNRYNRISSELDHCNIRIENRIRDIEAADSALDENSERIDQCETRNDEYYSITQRYKVLIDDWKEFNDTCWTRLDLMCEGCYPE